MVNIAEVEAEGLNGRGGRSEVATTCREAEGNTFGIVEHGTIALVLEDVAGVDGGAGENTCEVTVGEDVGDVGAIREFCGAREIARIAILGIDDVGRAGFNTGGWRQRKQVTIDGIARVSLQTAGQGGIERQDERANLVFCTHVDGQRTLSRDASRERAASEVSGDVLNGGRGREIQT